MSENEIFKSGKMSVDVAPRTVGILKTSIQFSTQDQGTAKLIFSLSKGGLPLPLSTAATAKIFLRMADGSVFEKMVSIVDQITGKLEYVLQEEISHPGLAKGELNINYANGQALSVCKFSFNIDASLMDQDIVPLAEYYVKDFNTLQADIEQRAAVIKETVDEMQLKVDEFESTAVTLDPRLTTVEEKVATATTHLADTAKKSDVAVLQTEVPKKADKTYVDTQILSLGKVELKGVYPTLSALQSAFPSGTTGIFVVTADGFSYFWNGTSWTKGSQFQSTGIGDGTITKKKTSFIKESSNLYNPALDTVGSVISNTGVITTNASYNYTGAYEVQPSSLIQYLGFVHAVFYDGSNTFISRMDLVTPVGTASSLTTPANAKTVRFTYMNTSSVKNRQFNFGNTLFPYEPYYAKLLDVQPADKSITNETLTDNSVGTNNLQTQSVTNDKIKDKSISKTKADFIVPGSNLYNPALDTVGKVISADGTITVNASYNYTGAYPVEAGETIQYVGYAMAAYYNASDVFISRVNTTPAGGSITVPANAKIIRFNYQPGSSYKNRQFNKGPTLFPYEPYEEVLQGVNLSKEAIDRVGSKLDLNTLLNPDDKYMFDVPIDDVFHTIESYDSPEYALFGNATTATEVYALYDNLMLLYPDYITKLLLGNDSFGNPISLYTFKPQRPSTSVGTKIPKVFLTTGTHGYEHVPGLITYLMFKQMCEKWHEYPQLEVLRFNVEFLVIPVVNPSGWNDYTRTNRNGIDINRNFPEGHVVGTPGTNTYGDTTPLTQLESQYVKSVFDNHPDIDIMYDFHNFAGTETTDYFIWIPTSSGSFVQHLVQKLIGRMTRKWRKEYAFIPTDYNWFAGYTDSTNGGMIQNHAIGRGIKYTATFEVAGRWWIEPGALPYNKTHKVTAVEALVNWLLINLNELQ
ncbi:BppU family phage baseplate upper protein [Peribacillus frigoritolerans]|uniref:BppU family phage baseplate upper protein n=1 Tax=Peribacillus frigoritolerans TaxID=450367 RepID=UPI003D2C41E6